MSKCVIGCKNLKKKYAAVLRFLAEDRCDKYSHVDDG